MPDTIPTWKSITELPRWSALKPEQQEKVRGDWLQALYREGKDKGVPLTGNDIREVGKKIGFAGDAGSFAMPSAGEVAQRAGEVYSGRGRDMTAVAMDTQIDPEAALNTIGQKVPQPEPSPYTTPQKILAPIGAGFANVPKTVQQIVDKIDYLFYRPADKLLGTNLSKQFADRLARTQAAKQENAQVASEAGGSVWGQVASQLAEQGLIATAQVLTGSAVASTAATIEQGISRAMAASSAIGGLQSASATFAERVKRGVDRGEDPQTAADRAIIPSVTAGLATAVITKAFGATGIQSVYRQAGPRGVVNRIVQVLKDAGMEGAEESADELFQVFNDNMTGNPQSIADAAKRTVMAFTLGGILGGGFSGVNQVSEARADKGQQGPIPVDPDTIIYKDGEAPVAEPTPIPAAPVEAPAIQPEPAPVEPVAEAPQAEVKPAAEVAEGRGQEAVPDENAIVGDEINVGKMENAITETLPAIKKSTIPTHGIAWKKTATIRYDRKAGGFVLREGNELIHQEQNPAEVAKAAAEMYAGYHVSFRKIGENKFDIYTAEWDMDNPATADSAIFELLDNVKPVPAAVLADYPDLAPKAEPSAPPTVKESLTVEKPTRTQQAAGIRKELRRGEGVKPAESMTPEKAASIIESKFKGKSTSSISSTKDGGQIVYSYKRIGMGDSAKRQNERYWKVGKDGSVTELDATFDNFGRPTFALKKNTKSAPLQAESETTQPQPTTDLSPESKSTLDKLAEEAQARISKRMGRLSASDPISLTIRSVQDLSDFAIVGAAKIARGVKDFKVWSKEMLDDFGKAIEPYLSVIHDMAEKEYEQHKFTKRVSADETVVKEVRDAVSERMHPVKHNVDTIREVENLVRKNGIDESERIFLRGDPQAKDEVRIGLGIGLMKYFGDAAKKAGTPELKESLNNRMIDIAEKMDEIGLNTGRSVQMYTQWNSWDSVFANPEAATVIAKRAARKAGIELTAKQLGEIKGLADEVSAAPEGFQRRDKMADLEAYIYRATTGKVETVQDALWALWYANIFSGWTSHAKNIIGNASAITLDTASLIATKPWQAFPAMIAAAKGFAPGAIEAAAHIRTGRSIIKGDIKYESGQINPLEITDFTRVPALKYTGIGYALNQWKYVGRFLVAGDVLFFKPVQEAKKLMMAHEIAVRQGATGKEIMSQIQKLQARTESDITKFRKKAQAEGLKGLNFIRRVNELQEQFGNAEMTGSANEFAARSTYNYQPDGHIGVAARHLAQATRDIPQLRLVAPVTRIVANVLNGSIDTTPWGFIRAARGKMKIGKDQYRFMESDERAFRVAKATLGTTAVAAILAASLKDEDKKKPKFRLHGKGPASITRRNQMYETGWRPYTMQFGNTYVSWLNTPLAVPLAIVGNLLDSQRYDKLDEVEALDRTWYAMVSGGTVITNMSFLSSASSLFKIMDTDSPASAAKEAKAAFARTAQSFVVPNLIKQIDDYFDPSLRRNDGLKIFLAEFPIAQARLQPRLNVLGEQIQVNRAVMFSKAKNHRIFDLLADKDSIIPAPSKSTEINGSPILDEDVFYDFAKSRGQALKRLINNNYSELKKMDNETFRKELRGLVHYANEVAKEEVQLKHFSK